MKVVVFYVGEGLRKDTIAKKSDPKSEESISASHLCRTAGMINRTIFEWLVAVSSSYCTLLLVYLSNFRNQKIMKNHMVLIFTFLIEIYASVV